MIDWFEAIWIAILQGATELFPVSSLGHAVIVPAVMGSGIDERAPAFLPFLVMLHVGTAAALLIFFWRDWLALAVGVLGLTDAHRVAESRRVFKLIVIATIPAVVIGFVLEKFFRELFGAPIVAAAFLALNGLMLLVGERIRHLGHRPLATLTVNDALFIGAWQCGALIPGISRSGATIVAGLLRGIDHEGSAHFSFLIALPIILGATVLEVPKLAWASMGTGILPMAAASAVVAGIVAFASMAFLMRYFRRNDEWALNPFGYYCIAIGLAAVVFLGTA